jgi:signal transduction histidine kinase
MKTTKPIKTTKPFRANAHLLKLLGDELIGDDRLAVFELVKNSYDADATVVDVTLNLKEEQSNIIVWDKDGNGMDENTILTKWMEIGTDSKRNQNKIRSKKFDRLPLGEKGVGRLAVHKLGTKLIVNTKSENNPEYKITIDWPSLIENANYIEDTKVDIEELLQPEFFKNGTGTRIKINSLNNKDWTRGEIRQLKRLLTSLISPFDAASDFNVNFLVPGREKDLLDTLDRQDILESSLWKYTFTIDEQGLFSYSYNYTPPSLFKELINKEAFDDDIKLELIKPTKEESLAREKKIREKLLLNSEDLNGIGPITGNFYVFLKDNKVLNAQGASQTIKTYLEEQSGIRVYRDGIRVFNYGEPNDDWLGLNAGRINSPGKKIDTGMVIAGIDLSLEESFGLREKTNREGFDDNSTFRLLKWIMASVIEHFHISHREDRGKLSDYILGKNSDNSDSSKKFAELVNDVRKSIKKHNIEEELGGKINQIESDFKQMRDVTVMSGIAGINLAVIFHEVERGVDELNESIKRTDDYEKLLKRADHLAKLLEGFAPLLRRNERKKFSIKALAQRVIELTEHRFEHHNIIISCPIISGESEDFEITAPFGLLQATMNNLIDNSIHWTSLKAEKKEGSYKPGIRIESLPTFFKEGPAIVVLDNGDGFTMSPEQAIQPFKSNRPSGMGVGLYYVDKVMETIGGKLLICDAKELDIADAYDGAAVVLIFKKEK